MFDLKIIGGVIVIIAVMLFIASVWLSSILLREADEIKAAAGAVGGAFDMVSIEVQKKLENNNVLSYIDLLGIVARVSTLVPGIKIGMDEDWKRKRVSIVIESGVVKATYTILATIIERPPARKITMVNGG